MPPEHELTFGGGLSETAISPVVMVAMILAIILILVLPRKYARVPLLFIVFLVPMGEQLVLGGVHLFVFRVVILFGCFRLICARFTSRATVFTGGLNSIDRTFFWCIICQAVAVILLFLKT